ncbi:MAG: molecular chaperone DnaJ [Caulobacteraceae bacterium]
MPFAAFAVALVAALAWVGRRPERVRSGLAVSRGLASALRSALEAAQAARTGREEEVSLSEARAILGVGAGANRTEIEAAWRRLMTRAHPDRGGTAGLAAQLNAARDRLTR